MNSRGSWLRAGALWGPVIVVTFVVAWSPRLARSASSFVVSWKGEQLSVSAADAPRAEVLREVAKQTGAKITGLENATGNVSVALTCADLGTGLRVLAGDSSYALTELPPRKKGGSARYEMSFAAPGTMRPDIMRSEPSWSALVEDRRTGRMVPAAAPDPGNVNALPPGSATHPGQSAPAVRIDR